MRDIRGQKFGRLRAIEPTDRRTPGNDSVIWICECDCGNKVYVPRSSLVTGNTRSCGCLQRETNKKPTTLKHGDARKSSEYNRLYTTWKHMRSRCRNPNDEKYKDYGGRGIGICDEWDDYVNFKEWALNNGYQDTLTIDRKNVDGQYEPNNCRWADSLTQANNTRVNRKLNYNGENHTVTEWARLLNTNANAIYRRLGLGWSTEDALTRPFRKSKRSMTND